MWFCCQINFEQIPVQSTYCCLLTHSVSTIIIEINFNFEATQWHKLKHEKILDSYFCCLCISIQSTGYDFLLFFIFLRSNISWSIFSSLWHMTFMMHDSNNEIRAFQQCYFVAIFIVAFRRNSIYISSNSVSILHHHYII